MKGKSLNRRKFAKILGAAGAALAVQPLSGLTSDSVQTQSKPSTNIADAGKLLSTSHAVTKSIVKQLTESGIDRKDIIIWDRRDMELKDVGFTSENYPGIKIRGTEYHDENGSFYDKEGKLYGERNIDREWFTGSGRLL